MFGQKIRERRQELKLNLRELGELTDLSASFLSQVENDQTEPSISSLQRIAAALKVPIFAFLNGADPSGRIVRREARKKLGFPNPHVQFELLTEDLTRQMAGFLIRLKAGESHQAQPLYKSTEELLYVLQGEVEIRLGGEAYRLEPGDSIHYEGAQLDSFTALGDQELVALCVLTPPAF